MMGRLHLHRSGTAWLIAQEALLTARAMTRTRAGLGVLAVLGALFLALHGVYACGLSTGGEASWLQQASRAAAHGLVSWMGLALLAAMLAWTALHAAVTQLFAARDLDLWLAAPIAAGQVVAVRGLSLAAQLLLPLLFLLGPWAHVGLFAGQARWLALYPALIGTVLLCVSMGMVVAMGLLAWLGLRRTQQGLQAVLAPGAAAGYLFLGPRLAALPHGDLQALVETSPGLWPAVLAVLLAGALAFHAAARLATNRFLQGARESAGEGGDGRAPAQRAMALRFRAGPGLAVLLKEWRLLRRVPGAWRDLWPLVPCGLLGVQAWRGALPAAVLPLVFGVLAVYTATALSGRLAGRVFTDEAAPELLACAPVARLRLQGLKLVAALLPAWLLAAPVALFALLREPAAAWWLLPCLMGGPLAAGCVGLATAPGSDVRDGDLGRRIAASVLRNAVALAWLALTFWLANGGLR